MNYLKDLEPGSDIPKSINSVIENPLENRNKYEYNKEDDVIELDRVLHSAVRYSFDYGFIPQTHYEDGDPLDVVVVVRFSSFPGCVIPSRPLGVLEMNDTGEQDDKVIAVPKGDPYYEEYENLDDIDKAKLNEIAEFFRTYKNLEEQKDVTVEGWDDKQRAYDIIEGSIERYKQK